MSRKDYQLIAETFQRVWGFKEITDADAKTINLLIVELSHSLSYDNPRFDSNKFKKAAGLKLI